MYALKLSLIAFIVGANARVLIHPKYINRHPSNIFVHNNEFEDHRRDHFDINSRIKRQVQGSMNSNPDGSKNVNFKLPLTGTEQLHLDAVGSINGARGGSFGAAGAGLALNSERSGLSVLARNIPGQADQIIGAGKLNLFHNDNHNLDANAFMSHTMPKNPVIPDFNVAGGNLDYMFKEKIGGSLGMSRNDLFKSTDYLAMGKLNLFNDRSSSLDLNAGFSRSSSPYFSTPWQPSGGLSYTRYF